MKKRIMLSAVFGALYYVAILLVDASSAGSTWREGAAHALFFGTFGFFMTFPVVLVLQAALTRRIRKWFSRPPGPVPGWEFVPIVLISLLFLSGARRKTPEQCFKQFVADRMPLSVHDVKCWHTSGYGNSSWILCFKIAPQDFDQVLTRHPYEKAEPPDEIKFMTLKAKLERRPSFPIPYPEDEMVVCYRYRDPEPGDGLRVSIYANQARTLVYVFGGDG